MDIYWPEDIAWIAGTDQGVWIAHEHLISHRTLQGEWTQYQRPQDAIFGVASSEASDLWISSGTHLWQWTGDALRARDGPPPMVACGWVTTGTLPIEPTGRISGQRWPLSAL